MNPILKCIRHHVLYGMGSHLCDVKTDQACVDREIWILDAWVSQIDLWRTTIVVRSDKPATNKEVFNWWFQVISSTRDSFH